MKSPKCDLCDHRARAETFVEWMEQLKPHYGDANPDVMSDSIKTKGDLEQWMLQNMARFQAA